MKKITPNGAMPLIGQVPMRDFKAIAFLEARGWLVTPLWTDAGWRYRIGRAR